MIYKFRKAKDNFCFVVVADLQDLDGQICRNFLNTGTVHEKDAARIAKDEEMRKFPPCNDDPQPMTHRCYI